MMTSALTRSTDDTLLEFTHTNLPNDSIDEKSGVIRRVKLLGVDSKNGYRYCDQALNDTAALASSVEVLIDHPDSGQESRQRGLLEGWAKPFNVRTIPGDGVYADLRYLKSHRETPVILERIRGGFGIGISINARGPKARRNGRLVVESVRKVNSFDLVLNPATTANLFESTRQVQATRRPPSLKSMARGGSVVSGRDRLREDFASEPITVSSKNEGALFALLREILQIVNDDGPAMSAEAKIKEIKKRAGTVRNLEPQDTNVDSVRNVRESIAAPVPLRKQFAGRGTGKQPIPLKQLARS